MGETMEKPAEPQGEVITLPRMDIRELELKLIGDTPLISHAWGEKAIAQIEAAQGHKARTAKGPRKPKEEFEASLYKMPNGDGYGYPAHVFKVAAVNACSHVDGVTKVLARGAFHVQGDMVQLSGSKPTMRRDMVRLRDGTATVRYRGEFKTWRVLLRIRYNANVLSAEEIVNLFNTAGFAIGIGDNRPQKSGNSFGLFHVGSAGE